MAKMLNYRFRYKVPAPFHATFCFEFVTCHTHIKREDQQWAAATRSPVSLASSEALARRWASSLRGAHSWAGSPWIQQNVLFTSESSCEQQAVLYQTQFVGFGLNFILLGFFLLFSAFKHFSKPFYWLLGCSLPGGKKERRYFVTYKTWKWDF